LVFDADIPVTHCWPPLVIVSGEEERFVERYDRDSLGNGELVQEYMTWNRENSVSIASSVRAARECARSLRDQLSLDTWEEINELYLWLGRESTTQLYWDHREEFYKHIRRGTQLILGMIRSSMLHEEPMRFLWFGAMIERSGQTARILDMHHHTMEREAAQQHDIVQTALWMSLLRACSGSEAFMKKNQGRVTAHNMVEFLLLSKEFPRSLNYCLRSSLAILRQIWPDPAPGRASIKALEDLVPWLEAETDTEAFELSEIHRVLTHVVDQTAAVCGYVSEEIQGPKTARESLLSPAPVPVETTGSAQVQSQS
jgi:uncharacterized alpha-E superfamily protein